MTNWQKTVTEHSDLVWRTAYRLLADHADAADCYQEAFIAALDISRRQQVRNWPGLLKKLTTNKALDLLRAKIRRRNLTGESANFEAVQCTQPSPTAQAQQMELAGQLRDAIAQLPDGQAEVFSLHHLSGMKYREIGKLLGMKTTAVGVTLHRARSRVRELLESSAGKASEVMQ